MNRERFKGLWASIANRWPFASAEIDMMDFCRTEVWNLAETLDPEWDDVMARAVADLIADQQQYGRPNSHRIQARMEAIRGKLLHPKSWKPDPKIEPEAIKSAGDVLYEWRVKRFGKVER